MDPLKSVLDSGPIYTETNMLQFPVEPFNTLSNLLFLLMIFYWSYQLKKGVLSHRFRHFLHLGLPLLFVGYIGGTVYHATRQHWAWMYMDFVPILLIALILGAKLWRRLLNSYYRVTLLLAVVFLLPRQLTFFLLGTSSNLAYSLNYLWLSLPVVLPVILFERKHQWQTVKWAMLSYFLLLLAISWRMADSSLWVQTNVPAGTHWLWHTFGALGSHFTLVYYNKSQLQFERRSVYCPSKN